MGILPGFKKVIKSIKTSAGYIKLSHWTSSQSVEMDDGTTLESNKNKWDDKYTKNEIDNKFSALETNIDWKESVDTYADISKIYQNPQDGWTVNVKDTDYTYRWNGEEWVAISANAIPKATQYIDGLLSKEDKINYDDANNKKHVHNNKSILDTITSTMINNWNSTLATGTCNTPQGTAAKIVNCPDFQLQNGIRVMVTFNNGNTSNYMTLNVNGTGAYFAWFPLGTSRVYNNEAISKLIAAGCAYEFIFQEDGSNSKWVYCGVVSTPESLGALQLTGGTLTGDIAIPNTPADKEGTVPTTECISLPGVEALKNYKSIIGACPFQGDMHDLISVRYMNGYGSQGKKCGMYIRTATGRTGDLLWGKQYGENAWQEERTIIDSHNITEKRFDNIKVNMLTVGDSSLGNLRITTYIDDSCNDTNSANIDLCDELHIKPSYNDFGEIVIGYFETEEIEYYQESETYIALYPMAGGYAKGSILGTPDNKWDTVYAKTGTIQTSDRKQKKDEKELDDMLTVDFVMGTIPKTYQYIDGASGRTHYGFIAQDIEELMNKLGMDSKDFAGFVKTPNTREKQIEVEVNSEKRVRNTNEVIPEGEEGYGYSYSLRYEEFIPILYRFSQIMYEQLHEQKSEIDAIKAELVHIKEVMCK